MNRHSRPILVDGGWESPPALDTFTAIDPATQEPLSDRYPVSDEAAVLRAIEAGVRAAAELRTCAPDLVARFLERCADGLEARADEVVGLAHRETALPIEPRLRLEELPRTTIQLRSAAHAVRERSFCHPVIDASRNIRSMYGPLGGPVVVMGPDNFPLAFNGVMGGDFAAAIAAGNPVIAKGHPSHPGTSRLLAEAAFEAVVETGLPKATLQFLYDFPPDVGFSLVSHPAVGATAFTGSRRAGLDLKAAAGRAGRPIYLEMSSVNPVFILPGALAERGEAIADDLMRSCSLGAGQYRTNPGLSVMMAGDDAERFIAQLRDRFESTPPGTLLSPGGLTALQEGVRVLGSHGARRLVGGRPADGPRIAFQNTLLRVRGEQFLEHPDALQTEAFGVVHLVVVARTPHELHAIAHAIEGSLTGCLYSATDGRDDLLYDSLAPILRTRVGRLLDDKMPTGVTVSPAMHHGGPYPATGHPGFTSVGIPASIRRFTALHCYDGVRPHRLPPELRDDVASS